MTAKQFNLQETCKNRVLEDVGQFTAKWKLEFLTIPVTRDIFPKSVKLIQTSGQQTLISLTEEKLDMCLTCTKNDSFEMVRVGIPIVFVLVPFSGGPRKAKVKNT